MSEEFVKSVFGQQPIQTHDLLSSLIIRYQSPCSENESKESNLRHGVLTIKHFLTNVQPEIPINKIELKCMSVVKANEYHQGFFHKIAQYKASTVIK